MNKTALNYLGKHSTITYKHAQQLTYFIVTVLFTIIGNSLWRRSNKLPVFGFDGKNVLGNVQKQEQNLLDCEAVAK